MRLGQIYIKILPPTKDKSGDELEDKNDKE